jgi:hypothetical protein
MATIAEPNVSIVGLPGSGKTTFLAALWHLIQSGMRERPPEPASTSGLNPAWPGRTGPAGHAGGLFDEEPGRPADFGK